MIMTDHKPLEWLHSVKDPTSRLIRWRLKLAEYDYKILYKAGKINCNADALSRNTVTPEKPTDHKDYRGSMFPLNISDTDSETLFDATPRRRDTINNSNPITDKINSDTRSLDQTDEIPSDPTSPRKSIIRNSAAITNGINPDTTLNTENTNINTGPSVEIKETTLKETTDYDASSDDTNTDEIFINPNGKTEQTQHIQK